MLLDLVIFNAALIQDNRVSKETISLRNGNNYMEYVGGEEVITVHGWVLTGNDQNLTWQSYSGTVRLMTRLSEEDHMDVCKRVPFHLDQRDHIGADALQMFLEAEPPTMEKPVILDGWNGSEWNTIIFFTQPNIFKSHSEGGGCCIKCENGYMSCIRIRNGHVDKSDWVPLKYFPGVYLNLLTNQVLPHDYSNLFDYDYYNNNEMSNLLQNTFDFPVVVELYDPLADDMICWTKIAVVEKPHTNKDGLIYFPGLWGYMDGEWLLSGCRLNGVWRCLRGRTIPMDARLPEYLTSRCFYEYLKTNVSFPVLFKSYSEKRMKPQLIALTEGQAAHIKSDLPYPFQVPAFVLDNDEWIEQIHTCFLLANPENYNDLINEYPISDLLSVCDMDIMVKKIKEDDVFYFRGSYKIEDGPNISMTWAYFAFTPYFPSKLNGNNVIVPYFIYDIETQTWIATEKRIQKVRKTDHEFAEKHPFPCLYSAREFKDEIETVEDYFIFKSQVDITSEYHPEFSYSNDKAHQFDFFSVSTSTIDPTLRIICITKSRKLTRNNFPFIVEAYVLVGEHWLKRNLPIFYAAAFSKPSIFDSYPLPGPHDFHAVKYLPDDRISFLVCDEMDVDSKKNLKAILQKVREERRFKGLYLNECPEDIIDPDYLPIIHNKTFASLALEVGKIKGRYCIQNANMIDLEQEKIMLGPGQKATANYDAPYPKALTRTTFRDQFYWTPCLVSINKNIAKFITGIPSLFISHYPEMYHHFEEILSRFIKPFRILGQLPKDETQEIKRQIIISSRQYNIPPNGEYFYECNYYGKVEVITAAGIYIVDNENLEGFDSLFRSVPLDAMDTTNKSNFEVSEGTAIALSRECLHYKVNLINNTDVYQRRVFLCFMLVDRDVPIKIKASYNTIMRLLTPKLPVTVVQVICSYLGYPHAPGDFRRKAKLDQLMETATVRFVSDIFMQY